MKKLVSGMKDKLKSAEVLRKLALVLLLINAAAVVSVVSYIGITAVVHKVKEMRLEKSKELCEEAYQMLCVKAFGCGATSSVAECDELVEKQAFCEKEEFPPNDLIVECTKQIRGLTCQDDIPRTCMTFME